VVPVAEVRKVLNVSADGSGITYASTSALGRLFSSQRL